MKGSADWSSSTLATTLRRSSLKAMEVTLPITTFLYLTWVLLASRPSAVWKLMLISGPADIDLWTTIDNPTRAATMGTSHTSETLKRRVRSAGAPGADGELAALEPG